MTSPNETNKNAARRRTIAFFLCVGSVGLCFLYAAFRHDLPAWWRDSGGGIPYVMFWILLWFVVFPARRAIVPICVGVVLATTALEFLQLVNPEPLATIRSTRLGLAWLGCGFVWSDIPPYIIGGILSYVGLLVLIRTSPWNTLIDLQKTVIHNGD